MRGIVKIFKATLLILLNLVFLCVGLVISMFPAKDYRLRARTTCMSICARWACAILGIRIRKTGLDRILPGSFVVANHCSYLDIPVLGSLFPSAFLAKKEVESWLLIGPLARLTGTVFVDRTSKRRTISTMAEIEKRLSSGVSVILFPEGTTNDGIDMLAFKSPFFKIPVTGNNPVLPVSLIYSHINEKPIGEDEKDCIAWHGTMSLLPHFWNLLGMKQIDVRIHFNPVMHDVIALDAAKARKLISAIAFERVRAGYQALMTEATNNL
jgi:lyso-ornithine lipid O-acyltransferase